MKHLLSLLLVVFCAVSIRGDEPDRTLHEKCLYPTVMVKNIDAGSYGSGVIVCSTKISEHEWHNVVLTCAHVIHKGHYIIRHAQYEDWSEFVDYEDYDCKVYGTDNEKDLAVVLFISEKPMPVAELGFHEKLYIGSKIFHFGCGVGEEPRLDRGEVTGFKRNGFVRMNMNVIWGDSGGPVYCNNKVVGFAARIKIISINGEPFPVTWISQMVPVGFIKTWDGEANNAFAFIYKTHSRLPGLAFAILKMEGYELSNLPTLELKDVKF